MSTICDNTIRIYGPRVYTRAIEEGDWEHLQRIYGTFKDFPLTDEEAQSLTNVWSRNSRLCRWPLNEETDMEHTTMFCLRSNDLPIGVFRASSYKSRITVIVAIIDPAYHQEGYWTEGTSILAECGWDHLGTESIVTETRSDYANKKGLRDVLDAESTRMSPGYISTEYRKTTVSRAIWEAYKTSDMYTPYPYTLYPVWPGEPA